MGNRTNPFFAMGNTPNKFILARCSDCLRSLPALDGRAGTSRPTPDVRAPGSKRLSPLCIPSCSAHDPESVIRSSARRLHSMTAGRAALLAVAAPRAAAEHPAVACRGAFGVVAGQARVVFLVEIVAPLPDIAVHVVEAPGVGPELPDGLGRLIRNSCRTSRDRAVLGVIAKREELSAFRLGRRTPTRPPWAGRRRRPPAGSGPERWVRSAGGPSTCDRTPWPPSQETLSTGWRFVKANRDGLLPRMA